MDYMYRVFHLIQWPSTEPIKSFPYLSRVSYLAYRPICIVSLIWNNEKSSIALEIGGGMAPVPPLSVRLWPFPQLSQVHEIVVLVCTDHSWRLKKEIRLIIAFEASKRTQFSSRTSHRLRNHVHRLWLYIRTYCLSIFDVFQSIVLICF